MADSHHLGNDVELPALFKLMAKRIPGVVWSVDLDLRFTASFGGGLDKLNLIPGQVAGKSLFEYFGTDDTNYRPIASHIRALQGESVDYQFVWEGRHFQVHVEPLVDQANVTIGCVGFAQDVTERKLAQEELRRRDRLDAERKLIRTLESVPEGVMLLDRDWRFKYVSRAAASIRKTTPLELIGRQFCEVYPEARQMGVLPLLNRAVERNMPVHFEGFYPEPLNIWYECDCHPTPDGALVYFRDVTQRKQAEEALQREQRALWRMVQASDHERRLITYDLHDGAAQEVMGALMFFKAYEALKSMSPAEAESSIQAGIAAVERASAEIRRLISGVRTPVLDRLGIIAAIDDLTHQLRQLPNSPKIVFRRNVAKLRLTPVLENCLYRIAQDLVTNACKHSQSDKIRVRLTRAGENVTLEVRDWGIGFDPKSVSEEWFGLEGVRERTRLLGGKLRIQSKPGKGTNVRVTLPAVEEP